MKPEADFQKALIDYAHLTHWTVAHFRAVFDARAKRWLTPVGADGKGFPDLCMVRERVVFAELKSPRGALKREQEEWVSSLELAGAEVYVWKPTDWDTIIKVLARHPERVTPITSPRSRT